jgi:hypothetical protein
MWGTGETHLGDREACWPAGAHVLMELVQMGKAAVHVGACWLRLPIDIVLWLGHNPMVQHHGQFS